ncbi:MAG: protein-L-isoaspartate(D-aspartate) O-methyltransferase, partial [Rectinema sp.]|nr:protein-L-isoaspartate(D-aspartate) O-methyltransferase [Rectinema sp.]
AEERRDERALMVRTQIAARGVRDPRVLEAMRTVPRHRFVPQLYAREAYEDWPLPIGEGQTISQPYIVAVMIEALALEGKERVLEIGSGSGYAAAVLSLLAHEVYGIERITTLWHRAVETLASLDITNVHLVLGDGYAGLPDCAPFDAILLSAAPRDIPPALFDQLAEDGRLVAPVGPVGIQTLVKILRRGSHFDTETLFDVAFVPMVKGVE